jgi:hypothetical protein
MKIKNHSILFVMATTVFSRAASGFRFGTDIRLESKTPLSVGEFGSHIALSESGEILMISAPIGDDKRNGSTILAFKLTVDDTVNNTNNANKYWEPLSRLEDASNEFAMDPEGTILAVRRYNGVQLYALTVIDDEENTRNTTSPIGWQLIPIGIPVPTLCPGRVSIAVTTRYMVVGCPSFDSRRGQVAVYIPKVDVVGWITAVTKEGEMAGDRLGARVALDDTVANVNRLFYLVFSVPGSNNRTGLVQVFEYNLGTYSIAQIGTDLVGAAEGEEFGAALAMSRGAAFPFLTIGAPGHRMKRGRIVIVTLAREERSWKTLAEFEGSQSDDSFGKYVSMATDSRRVAASSSSNAGLVVIYELNPRSLLYEPIGELEGTEGQFYVGRSVALNGAGSMIVSGSPNYYVDGNGNVTGAVHALIDQSSFCSSPDFDEVEELGTDMFLLRQVCRNGSQLVDTNDKCASLTQWFEGRTRACVWRERANNTLSQSPSASVSPSSTPSAAPSVTPSLDREHTASSKAPTRSPLSATENGCRCDSLGECQDGPLSVNTPLLWCLPKLVGTVTLSRVTLEQGNSRVISYDAEDGTSSATSQVVVMTCTGGRCRVDIFSIPTFLFSLDRPETVVVHVVVSLEQGNGRRQLVMTKTSDVVFAIVVDLLKADPTDFLLDKSLHKKENIFMAWFVWLPAAISALLLVLCCHWRLRLRKTAAEDIV